LIVVVTVGYWRTISLLLVAPLAAMVLLATVQFGPIAWPVTLALIIAPLYYFNKSRKHNRPEAFDDRLNEERMRAARDDIIAHWKKKDTDD
jgi:hypothetical protein